MSSATRGVAAPPSEPYQHGLPTGGLVQGDAPPYLSSSSSRRRLYGLEKGTSTLWKREFPTIPQELIDRADTNPEYLAFEENIYEGLDEITFPEKINHRKLAGVKAALEEEPEPMWCPQWVSGQTLPLHHSHNSAAAMAWMEPNILTATSREVAGQWETTPAIAAVGAEWAASWRLGQALMQEHRRLIGHIDPEPLISEGLMIRPRYACTRAKQLAGHEVGGHMHHNALLHKLAQRPKSASARFRGPRAIHAARSSSRNRLFPTPQQAAATPRPQLLQQHKQQQQQQQQQHQHQQQQQQHFARRANYAHAPPAAVARRPSMPGRGSQTSRPRTAHPSSSASGSASATSAAQRMSRTQRW
mmetsp:Transcript_23459/g.50041  ORF Transcript_23459/g.50041 Transcript_23459/m.50041 type:complete len:359 (-) Transcript_23459:40-1116(-)